MSDALHRLYDDDERTRRFDECGRDAWVLQDTSNPNRFRISANYCHDRFCSPCLRCRATLIANNLTEFLDPLRVRMVTLTVATDGLSLVDSLKLLYTSFHKLRRSKLWKRTVTGGVGILEVKRSATQPRWHPHLHVLVEGGYIPQRELTAVWHAITKTSFIVDVRMVNDARHAAHYVTKYLTKPTALRFTHETDLLDETIVALHGRRTILAFGSWYRLGFTRPQDDTDWTPVDRLERIIEYADQGDEGSMRILAILESKRKCPKDTENLKRGPPPSDYRTSRAAPSAVITSTANAGPSDTSTQCATGCRA